MKVLMIATAILMLASSTASAAEAAAITNVQQYGVAAWSPYLVGGLIGLLSLLTFYFSNKPLGASTAYARAAGMIGESAAPSHTQSMKYFQDNPPKVGWEVMLVIGIVVGAFIAAASGGELTGRLLPPMWQDRFGPDSSLLRITAALIGGVLLAVGARMAGGCTSGHGISGTLQMSVGSWISAICFFIGGIVTAMWMYVW